MQVTITYENHTTRNIDLPDSTTQLTQGLRENFQNASSVSIPNGIHTIGNDTFAGCTSLSSISLPDSLIHLSNGAFTDCTSLASISLPAPLTHLGFGAFAHCTSLSSISLPDSLTHLGGHAFQNCTSLASIAIPASLTHLGNGAFNGCTRLSSIDIPSSLTHLDNAAFAGCTSLSSIDIPPSLNRLGNYAFLNCTSLSSISLPASLTDIGYQTFAGCTRLTTILTSQALNQDIRDNLHQGIRDFLPQSVNVIYIETLIPSLAGATPKQIGVVLSLVDLNASSFDQPAALHLHEEALQQMDKATLVKTFPSFSLRQLHERFSLNDSTYQSLHQTLLQPFLKKLDGSNDFLLPILEHLPLQDLANFAATSNNPLASLLASEKATTANSFFSLGVSQRIQIISLALFSLAFFLSQLNSAPSSSP